MPPELIPFLTSGPAWVVYTVIFLYLLDKLLDGRVGDLLGGWLSSRSRRKDRVLEAERRREESLLSIIREMIEERGREADELERLVHRKVDHLEREMTERLVSVLLKLQEIRNLSSAQNTNLTELTDEMRAKFERQTERDAEILEKLKSLYGFLIQRKE